jgi:hypothetical protein
VILLPETSASLLGVRSDPVVLEHAYVAFSVVNGVWQHCQDADAQTVFAPFPLVTPVLRPRAEILTRLIESLALPEALREIFANGLIRYQRHNLCASRDQHRIDEAFRPLMTSMRHAPSGTDLPPWIAVHLRPLDTHQSRVYSALAHLYVAGDAAENGILAWGLASLFFRAASSEMFGLEDNAPQFLTYYAFSWLNQAIFLNPVLLEALGGVHAHLEIATQTVLAPDALSHMAVLSARLAHMFNEPFLANHPHARRVRADLCR